MATIRPIEVVSGVQTNADFTNQSTPHYVFADKVRFKDGFPEKIGGWVSVDLDNKFGLLGCTRNIYSYFQGANINYILGTNSGLYAVNTLNDLNNITPVQTASTENNVYSSNYGGLANNPLTTTLGSRVITVSDPSHRLLNGDVVQLSGAVDTNGIPAVELNTSFEVFNATANTYDVSVSTTSATSSGVGGGNAIIRSTRLVTVTLANTLSNGDLVEISNTVSSVGGIPASSIDGLRPVQNVTSSEFDIVADTFATSSESAAGGNTDIAFQIEEGACDATVGAGYGLGQYGVGQYGVAKASSSPTLPRIWSFDRFGNLTVLTAGSQTALYRWNGITTSLPEVIPNAPEEINYTFVSNEIVVTLGADGVGNRIQWSDQGNEEIWTPDANNLAGSDDIEGASTFISHARVRDVNLLFTASQVYTFRFINRPFVWETKQLDPSRGLIAQNARIVVNGVCYWMGKDNFYRYRGANVEIVPSNTTTQTTLLNEVFNNINIEQQSKTFCWYNEKFSEIWWHYPAQGELEPTRIARFNVRDETWVTDTMDRTAGEYPTVLGTFPRLISSSNVFYQHENGADDDGQPLQFRLDSPFFFVGSDTVEVLGVIPDSTQTGQIDVTVNAKEYPQSPVATIVPLQPITQTTEKIVFKTTARYYQYLIQGNELGQTWRGGAWSDDVTLGSPRG